MVSLLLFIKNPTMQATVYKRIKVVGGENRKVSICYMGRWCVVCGKETGGWDMYTGKGMGTGTLCN